MNDIFDLDHARNVLRKNKAGSIELFSAGYLEMPSPFARPLLAVAPSDILAIRDRAVLASELDSSTLARILTAGSLSAISFAPEMLRDYFTAKLPIVHTKSDFFELLELLLFELFELLPLLFEAFLEFLFLEFFEDDEFFFDASFFFSSFASVTFSKSPTC